MHPNLNGNDFDDDQNIDVMLQQFCWAPHTVKNMRNGEVKKPGPIIKFLGQEALPRHDAKAHGGPNLAENETVKTYHHPPPPFSTNQGPQKGQGTPKIAKVVPPEKKTLSRPQHKQV